MKRFYQIAITFLSWAFFLSISYKNIQGAKVEIMLLGLVMALGILFTAFSGVLFSWTAKQNFILACVLFILFAAKHFLTSYTSPVASFYYFAIVPFIFCMGEVFLIFAIWDLYQKNSTKFRTIFYNGMVLVTSSYSCQTMLLLYFFLFFILFCILFSRSELTPGSSLKAKKLKKTSIALLLLFFCLSPAIFIAPNRSRLIAYHPLRFFSTYSIGFSPFGFLASKNIKISQESVFQYHAAPGVYYLRGKVLDTYKQGEWKLSCFHQTKLQETPKEIFMHYKLYPDIEMNSPVIHKLSFVQAPQEYLFAPLSCSRVVFAQKFSLYKDQEQIVWAEKPFPETFWIHIQKMPLESLDSMDSQRYLQIPEESKAYFYQKAKKIAGEVSDPARQARKIANYLKDNYPYSLEVKTEGEDPLVSFLEKKHAAHCEIFASAFIMMARALDIPARYVKGYCAHEWNDIGKYIDVRLCDAHAWAEVYIPEKGWVTIEATPVAVWQEEIKRRNSVLLLLWEKILDFCKDAKEEIGKIFHQKMLFILLILIALSISLAGLYILRRLFLYKPTPGIQPKNPKIKKLYEKFLSQECLSNIRGKYQQETIRNYFQYIYNFLPDNRKSFARELLFSLEKDIYSEKAIPDIELERLEELFSIECKTL